MEHGRGARTATTRPRISVEAKGLMKTKEGIGGSSPESADKKLDGGYRCGGGSVAGDGCERFGGRRSGAVKGLSADGWRLRRVGFDGREVGEWYGGRRGQRAQSAPQRLPGHALVPSGAHGFAWISRDNSARRPSTEPPPDRSPPTCPGTSLQVPGHRAARHRYMGTCT